MAYVISPDETAGYMDQAKGTEGQGHVRAVDRALTLLSSLQEQPTGLRQLAAAADLPVPTALRLLRSLENAGFVRRTGDGSYVSGPAVTRLAYKTMADGEDRWVIHETVQKLFAKVNETVTFNIADGDERLCTEVAVPDREIRWATKRGARKPIYQGPSGVVLIAFGDTERLLQRIPVVDGRFSVSHGPDQSIDELRQEIERVIRDGVARTVEHPGREWRAVSCPLFLHGAFIGALGVTVPTTRADPAAMAAIEQACRDAAAEAGPQASGADQQSGYARHHGRRP
jgi:DNA-binding IclR family transcriptional regulator